MMCTSSFPTKRRARPRDCSGRELDSCKMSAAALGPNNLKKCNRGADLSISTNSNTEYWFNQCGKHAFTFARWAEGLAGGCQGSGRGWCVRCWQWAAAEFAGCDPCPVLGGCSCLPHQGWGNRGPHGAPSVGGSWGCCLGREGCQLMEKQQNSRQALGGQLWHNPKKCLLK